MTKQFNSISFMALIFSVISFSNINAQSNIGGVLSSDTILSVVNSPYIVTNNLLVAQGVKVTVEPGVHFLFNQGIYLQVDGELRAIGNEDSIWFTKNTASGATTWGGIIFTDLSNDYDQGTGNGCILESCILEYGSPSVVLINYSSPKIAFSQIRNGYGIGVDGDYTSSPLIINNKIYNVQGIALSAMDENWGLIQGNEIFNCISGEELIFIGRVIFTDNFIHDCPSYGIAIRAWDTVVINNNVIENIPYAAIGLLGGDAHIIKCNTLRNNGTNMVITCERYPLIINNNFWNFQDWNVYWSLLYGIYTNGECHVPAGSGNYATIDLSNNYWGGLSNSQMDASIWDFADDFSLKALISYTPTIPDSVNFATSDCSYPVGINEALSNDDGQIEIYPNPFHDVSYLTIKNNLFNEHYQVSILDMYGRVVKKIQVTNPERIQISRDGLVAGLYAYQIITPEKKFYSGKFIVQ